jgi:hypothetical protein
MIGQHPESNTFLIITRGIFFTGNFFSFCNGAGEYIGIIIDFLCCITLPVFRNPCRYLHAERQRLQAAVFQAVVLHKYIVPYFYYLWMSLLTRSLPGT